MYQSKEFLSQLFTKVSKGFDQSGPKFFSHFGKLLVDISGIENGSKVLDVGCGRGASLIPTAKLLGSSGNVVGIDISKGMVDELDKDVKKLELNNVELIAGDVEEFEFIDEFDRILCGFSIASFPDVKVAFDKFRQFLKPGGKIAVSNWHKNAHNGWDWVPKLIGEHLEKDSKPPVIQSEEYEFDTAETMTQFLEKMGLANIEVKVADHLFYYKNEENWWQTSLNNGMRGVLDRMNDKSLENFRKAAFKELTQMKTEYGIPYPAKVVFGGGEKQ